MAFRIGDRVRFKQGVSAGANYRGLIGTITGAPRTGMTDERIVMCNLGMTKSLTSALGYSSWRSQRERRRVLAALSHSARRASGWALAEAERAAWRYSLDCSRTQPDAKAANVLRLAKAGQTRATIAADLGIGVASVDRILAEARATA
jgi:hypothetical protein